MNSIFNSISEIKLRVLLLLANSTEDYVSSDKLVALDFITIYGVEFKVSDSNLHGDNRYKYSEIASRRELITLAIKELYLQKMIDVNLLDGFKYKITDKGLAFISSLESDYTIEYSEIASKSFEKYGEEDEAKLLKFIQSKSKLEKED